MKSDNTVKYRYVSSVRIDDILFAVVGRKHYYFVKDQLGSVRKILDKDNRVVNSYGYKPFGGIVAEKEGVENRYLFTGRERINLGVYYYRARVYLSDLKRFNRFDPLTGRNLYYFSWNRFVYVGNNPVIYVDSNGMYWEYNQTTGEMIQYDNVNGKIINEGGIGYAGHGDGINNTELQNVSNVGPLPEGLYTIGNPVNNSHTGPHSLPLTPDENNEMYGRNSFLIHGDNAAMNQTASEGCIILPRNIRETISHSNDHELHVISGKETKK